MPTVLDDPIVQMVSGASHETDDIPFFYPLAPLHYEKVHMAVTRSKAVTVIDFHIIPHTLVRATGLGHYAVRGSMYGRSGIGGYVQSQMWFFFAIDWMETVSEGRGYAFLVLGVHGVYRGNVHQWTPVLLNPIAKDIHKLIDILDVPGFFQVVLQKVV